MAQSAPSHSGGTLGGGNAASQKAKPLEVKISGNTVSLDRELMKSADTAMDYQLVTNLYRKQLGMFRAVLSRGSS
jgi:flagellar basal-body rod protein FlgB